MLSIGERLKIARKGAGHSLRSLADEVNVSAQALSKYERGSVTPNSAMLLGLAGALGVRVEFFFRTQQVDLERPAYRKRTTLSKKQEKAIQARVQEWLERYLEVEALFPEQAYPFDVPAQVERSVSSMADVEHVADQLRAAWELGTAPIEDLTALLEDKGVKIHLVDGYDQFDACTFALNGRTPVIVTRQGLPGDRQRFNVAHELGHFLLEMNGQLAPDLKPERVANRFAGAFLVPARAAYRELGKDRQTLSLHELYALKHRYGLSMQAWVYRARDLGILSESAAVSLFRRFRAMGRQEPGDSYPDEKPTRMERLVHRALAEDMISRSRAAELLGISIDALSGERFQHSGSYSILPDLEEARNDAGSTATLRH